MPKILVADDSHLDAHLISRSLQDRGSEVVVASEAIQAFVVATQCRPGAVILEISMPGRIGMFKKLKLSTKTERKPVPMITGNPGNEMRDLVKCPRGGNLPETSLDSSEFCTTLSGLTVEFDSPSIAIMAH
jgi:DNA-binding response OmpR family regulator